MDIQDIVGWVEASKNAVELLKSAYALLPKGRERDEIADKVKLAEQILQRSDAKLAKELGLHLCDCTWPPQIMRWKQAIRERECPNPECQHRTSFNRPLPQGGNSWA
jgi:hypothetical protein